MCRKNESIQLCSCATIEYLDIKSVFKEELEALKSSSDEFTLILWTLKRFVGNEWTGMDGMLIEPLVNISNELSDTVLRDHMNKTNCFDFDYQPLEGDTIIFEPKFFTPLGAKVKKKKEYLFMSLIFRRGKWTVENYDVFYTKTEFLNMGILKKN